MKRTEVKRGHHPLIGEFDRLQQEASLSDGEVVRRAGVAASLIGMWRGGRHPRLANFDAVLNVLGYRLAIVPLSPASPPPSGGSGD